jgi:hypothetical protein
MEALLDKRVERSEAQLDGKTSDGYGLVPLLCFFLQSETR